MTTAAPPSQDLTAAVLRARDGDERAFEELYRARAAAVYRYAKSIVRDPTLAEDVAAQTFLRAWRALPRLQDPRRFDGWLFRIAHNAALNETRRQAHAGLESAPEPAEPSRFADPEAMLNGQTAARAVQRALLALPEPDREVLILRFVLGLSHDEVAGQIGKTRQNARVLQFRALQRLRAELETAGFQPD